MNQNSETYTFLVPGTRRQSRSGDSNNLAKRLHSELTGEIADSVSVSADRSSGLVKVQATPGEHIVVVRIEDGPDLLLHPENARDLFSAQQNTGGRGSATQGTSESENRERVIEVPVRLGWSALQEHSSAEGSVNRGRIKDVALKAIEIIKNIVLDRAAEYTSEQLAQMIDGKVDEGIYKLYTHRLAPLKGTKKCKEFPVEAEISQIGGRPVLVFLHGTFSTTDNSFGKFWLNHSDKLEQLFEFYQDQVYALDHQTLSASPIDNALTLVSACKPGTRLHLLSYSRGGLIAEVLVRAASAKVTDDALSLFNGQLYKNQRKALETLIKQVADKQISIERVVRVACPARGTLLASKRLDAYLSVIRYALKLANVPALPGLVEFLQGVASTRLQPDKLPGLAAMVPDAPLIQWIHSADEPVTGELRVVAGDLAGDSVGSWLKTLVADAYYWTDNDLVVNTNSMYGGAARAGDKASRFVFESGGDVSHFRYFVNPDSIDAIVDGLKNDEPSGYERIGPLSYAGKTSDGLRGSETSSNPQMPAVFVIPGILGSHLARNDKRIWLSWRWFNRMHQLAYSQNNNSHIQADGAIEASYEALQRYLGQSHDVREFSFDWRLPMEEEALRLSQEISTALDERLVTNQPVRIVAHSMGGIVVRAMQLVAPDLWQRLMEHENARIVFLGTPHQGSYAPMQVLTGDDTFGNTLIGVGSPFRAQEGRHTVAQFPGLLQLQAGLSGEKELYQQETWAKLARRDVKAASRFSIWHHSDESEKEHFYNWGIPDQTVLDQAVSFRERLDQQVNTLKQNQLRKMHCVLGKANWTPAGFRFDNEKGLVYIDISDGDGRVTRQSAWLNGAVAWQADCAHAQLPEESTAFAAYLDLLESGETDLLPGVVSSTRGGAESGSEVRRRESRPSRTPMRQTLPAMENFSLVDAHIDTHKLSETPSLQVSVENSDLIFVRDSLLLGHYRASNLHGTERVANELINGTMRESLDLGQYPDFPGQNRIFANRAFDRAEQLDAMQPTGPDCVIVVGLGEEGALNSAELGRTIRMGVLARAQQHYESAGAAPQEFSIASTLIASGGYGISAGLSALQIVKGVQEANQAIMTINNKYNRGKNARRWPVVSYLRFIELYSSRATEAWLSLRDLADDASTGIDLAPEIKVSKGAMKSLSQLGYRGDTSDILSALVDDQASIAYTLATKRARTEVRTQSTQIRLVKRLVETASNDSSKDRDVPRTLFRLLMPLELRSVVNSTAELLLELNDGTAGIPWEMLDSTSSVGSASGALEQESLP